MHISVGILARLAAVVNLVGAQINGLGFFKEIARGARSKIFLVSSEGELRTVKLFLPAYSHFAEREYRFGMGLEHSNLNYIEKMIDVQGFKGVLMPYVYGQKLSHYYNVSLDEFLGYFKGLLAGIQYLHDKNIVHRDVKPENVIVVDGVAKLLDFDLATHASQEMTTKSTLAGTIVYFSPEEVKGQRASSASDLYAAGIILYRALTGEVPFTGSIQEVIYAHKNLTPYLPSSFNAKLEPFDALITKVLAKDPRERFTSANELIAAINKASQAMSATAQMH